MSPGYTIAFRPRAAKAFHRLDPATQRQLVRKLDQRKVNPEVPADRVREIPNGFKIKLRASGLRLIYLVRNRELVILVLSIGRREREEAYRDAIAEYGKLDG
jgi:mRNA interferase RelE/StbE